MMARKKGRGWFWKKRQRKPKPQIDHSRPFVEQIEQLQAHIDQRNQPPKKKEPRSNVVIDEVIISTEQLRKITYAWLYEQEEKSQPQRRPGGRKRQRPQPPVYTRKQRLMWLMLLYRTPNVVELAKELKITKQDLLTALEELKRL